MVPVTVARTPSAPARLLAGAVVLAPLLLGLLAPAALGHEAGGGIRYRLTGVSPEVDGLTVQVLRGLAAQVVVGNATGQLVEVLDDAGEPFLRIGPDGVVGDVASPAWRASDRPFGLGGADPAGPTPAPSRWVELSPDPSWGWYDHRLHERPVTAPPDAEGPVVLDAWTIPLRVGDAEVAVTGQTVAGPPRGVVVPRLVSGATVGEATRVTLLPGAAPGLLLEVGQGHEATVRGEAGEPFLRFADGVVRANAASPTWHRIGGATASRVEVDAEARPVWTPVAQSQRFGWIEPRAAAPEIGEHPPADQAVLSTWAVPVEVDGEATTIVGELRWAVLAGAGSDAGGVPWPNLGLAAAGVAAVAALAVVRRRAARRGAAAASG